jgi:OOP family OmpA-OmpF porin
VNIVKKVSRLLPGMVLVCIAATSMQASADEPQPWEAGLGIGFIDPDDERNLDSDPAGMLTLGRRFNNVWGAELAAMFGDDITLFGLRGLYHFNELPGMWTPYVSFGAGITDPGPGDSDTTGLVGVGVKRPISENLGVRAEINGHQGFDTGATDFSMFVGLTWSWGAAAAAAPAAQPVAPPPPPPAPADADKDGVPDAQDKCPGTAAGVKVNAQGCEPDSDGDGVVDSRDNCPGTAAGVKVNAQGCEPDSDGDGVVDSRDNCLGTAAGVKVNAKGCETDSDGDGVLDSADKCPATPSGAKVEADGCPAKLMEKVGITLKLNFDTNKSDIKPEFADEISRVANFMRQYPGTSVVIEGHTDNTGNSEYNRTLSQSRAEAVARSLVSDHGIAENRVKAVGYGDAKPIADNATVEGRAQNRRVEAAIEETVVR